MSSTGYMPATVAVFVLLIGISITSTAMAKTSSPSPSDSSRDYIVLIDKSLGEFDYLKTLSTLLGSEKLAKEALLSIDEDGDGFDAKLTPQQANDLSKKLGVLQVLEMDSGVAVSLLPGTET